MAEPLSKLNREVGEIKTMVTFIFENSKKNDGRLDKLESAENKRVGRHSIIAAIFGIISGIGSHIVSKYL